MAERVLQQTCPIFAGVAIVDNFRVPLSFDGWAIEQIDLEVPPGPAGTMGFYLDNNGVQWVPRSPGEWLVWDDRSESFYPTGYPTAGGWGIVGYNEGLYDHSVIVRFHVNPVEFTVPSEPQPLVITFVERDVPNPLPVIL